MTLEADGTIDLVAHDPTHDDALLIMVHDQPNRCRLTLRTP
jgi:hypothetical protein